MHFEFGYGRKKYSKKPEEKLVYNGLYFRDEKTFFALCASAEGPLIFYEGKTYPITKDLTINVVKNGKNRIFTIEEYGIEIHYIEPPYIDFDSYSPEENEDLFYGILIKYKTEKFYEQHTKQ